MKRVFVSFFCFLMLTLVVLNFAFNPVVSHVVENYLQHQINAYARDLTKGIFYMLRADLDRRDPAQWPSHIASLHPQFGFPIDLRKEEDIDLEAEERRQLGAGMIVVKEDGEMFYQKAGPTDHVVVLGPIKDFDPDLIWLEVGILAALILVIGILTFTWALPFGRKLHTIIAAAEEFGNGRFESRAKLPGRSVLAPLAKTFNHMAERIQQLIAAQKELTNAVSHELRTPISRIRFSLELLDGTAKTMDRKHYIQEILKDLDELDDLVTESLTYARFDQGAPAIEWQVRVLESWLQQIALTCLKGRPNIQYYCHNSLSQRDRQVLLEPRYMGRAMANLIQNAAKHAQNRVELTLVEDEEECIIHVDDDGPGIPKGERRRVFSAFTRLDTSRNRASGGYGLGLAIVHRVVTWHGGKAEVSESPLGGARLTIIWPGFATNPPILPDQ